MYFIERGKDLYKLVCKETIDSAHHIPDHCGKCKLPHGHRWKITVELISPSVSKDGMILDFGEIKGIIRKLDHRDLNDFLPNPTAENLSKYLYDLILEGVKLRDLNGIEHVDIKGLLVRVQESEGCYVEYWGEN